MKTLFLAAMLFGLQLSTPALASDWGCTVLMCLSNPAGPEAVSQCVAPIQKLWHHLSHGGSFPTCSMGSSNSSNYGGNTWASSQYCAPGLVQLYALDPTNASMASCNAAGVIDVVINGVPSTRIWWGVGGQSTTTVIETAAAGTISYDPSQSTAIAVAAYQAQQQQAGLFGYAP